MGYVSKSSVSGSTAFTLPVSATILAAVSMLKSNQNNGSQLGWHGIGSWSTTQINVTWNTYEGRSPVNAVGYIAVCKAQTQWGITLVQEWAAVVLYQSANEQQWGLMATQNYTTQRRITFGLAFPSACYIVITKSYKVTEQDDSTYGDIGVNTFDKTGFYARNGRQKDLPGMYFALGK